MIPITKVDTGAKEAEEVKKVLKSGWIMNGPVTENFENKLASLTNNKYCVCVSSGTAALYLALKTLDLKKYDEVITPSYSFVASAYVINSVGATPIFADVDPKTFNITTDEIEKRITKKTKAIMMVHQFGLPCDTDPIYKLAKKHKLSVIEDAACAIGSLYKNRPIGKKSRYACFSFHPRKVITTGEGGAVITKNLEILEKIRALRNHGIIKGNQGEDFKYLGFNLRITDIQSAIGVVQLTKLSKLIKDRKQAAYNYNKLFKNNKYFDVPFVPDYAKPNWQSYAIVLKEKYASKRNEIIIKLKENEIVAKTGIAPIHQMSFYKSRIKLPNTEYLSRASILLPMFSGLTKTEMNRISKQIFKVLET